jgi:hypothetical protein
LELLLWCGKNSGSGSDNGVMVLDDNRGKTIPAHNRTFGWILQILTRAEVVILLLLFHIVLASH